MTNMLSTVEVQKDVLAAQQGDVQALEKLVTHFRPLVRATARIYTNVSFEDAEQEGYTALLLCIHLYEPTMGVPFAGYAMAKVRGDVRTAMRRLWTYQGRVTAAPTSDVGELLLNTVLGSKQADVYGPSILQVCVAQCGLSPRELLSVQGLLAGLTCSELAERAGVQMETVKTWRKRALRKLRAALEEW
jgi:RNA polymerase sigma factor (sigma-70 family)